MIGLATFFGEVEIEIGNEINSLFHAENMHQGYPWTVSGLYFSSQNHVRLGRPIISCVNI
jgi:hypothetical protein